VLLATLAMVASAIQADTLKKPARPDTLEELTVSATRTRRRVPDEPTRVEVLGRDEITEKLLMTPGDIQMLLNESSGLRVQNTSPSLGSANLRIQGLRGRYTRILSDGLPLAGIQTGGLGLLQIPPMDLGKVEVVKGVASPFYGGSAVGGVVNLISRQAEGTEALLNFTTLGGADIIGWTGGQLGDATRGSLIAGLHRQDRKDRDGDGWADVPGYRRLVARPRGYWTGAAGQTVFGTVGLTLEDREGGTLPDRTAPDGQPFPETLASQRYDAGVVAKIPSGTGVWGVRASATMQRKDQVLGDDRERDRHASLFAEVTRTVPLGGGALVFGGAAEGDLYRNQDVPGFDDDFWTVSGLAQYDWDPGERVGLTLTARLDHHNVYGTFLSPRAASRIRLNDAWTLRMSLGSGFVAPTPFIEETEAIGLARVEPLTDLRSERVTGGSVDIGGTVGGVELNATLFGSLLSNAVGLRPGATAGMSQLANAEATTRTGGAELLARAHAGPFAFTLTYTGLVGSEVAPDDSVRRTVPLNPRHAAGLVTVWEHERGRVGLETFVTGGQRLDENPYRESSPTYVILGLLAEQRVGPVRLFLNLENLTDRRQTRWDPIVRPTRADDGRWTVDLWAPAEGRVVNGGVRIGL
jgi:iron complex outermembrane receptor protein